MKPQTSLRPKVNTGQTAALLISIYHVVNITHFTEVFLFIYPVLLKEPGNIIF